MDDERASAVKELAGAVSAQSQVANRYWIGLSTVAFVSVMSRPQQAGGMSLPLGFGLVESQLFYTAIFGLLVVLTIAFASAHAQQVRAQRLAHRAMDRLGNDLLKGTGVHPRDFFDALRLPSVIRLAPLAQLLKGRDLFFDSPVVVSATRRWMTAVYYLLLKIASWPVYFGFPAAALWFTFARADGPWWLPRAMLVPAVIASGSLGHVWLEDIRYVWEVRRIILQPIAPPNTRLQPTVAGEREPPRLKRNR